MANKRRIILYVVAFALVLFYVILEFFLSKSNSEDLPSIYASVQRLKSITYISFISIYMFYLNSKLNDKRIIRSMMIISMLLIFWHIMKITRWDMTNDPKTTNFFWYLFYIPIIFIPISYLYLFTSLSFFHTKKKRAIITTILLIGTLLSALVITNNFHNLVFIINKTNPSKYTYNFGYFIVVGYCAIISIIAATMGVIGAFRVKSLTKKGIMWLCLEILGILIYFVLYALNIVTEIDPIDDLTAATTIFLLLFNNTMIYAGVLPVSLEHRKIFYKSHLALVITDENGHIYDKTKYLSNINEETIKLMEDKNSLLKGNISITKKKIKAGYIYYERDLESIINLKKEIEENKKNLESRIELKLKTKELKEEIIKNQYRNDVFDKFNNKVKEVTNDIKQIEESDLDNKTKIKEISLILIYLKRACLFSVFNDSDEIRSTSDLTLALHELIEYLKKLDMNCNILFTENELSNSAILAIYVEVYSFIVIARKNNYKNLFIRVVKVSDNIEIVLSINNANYIEGLESQIIEDGTLIAKKVIS